MGTSLSVSSPFAIAGGDRFVSKPVSESWFPPIVQTLYPETDVGYALHLVTGFHERTCYRYAADGLPAGGDFVRALIRSEHGGVWLPAIMDGCEAAWWRDLEVARELIVRFKVERR